MARKKPATPMAVRYEFIDWMGKSLGEVSFPGDLRTANNAAHTHATVLATKDGHIVGFKQLNSCVGYLYARPNVKQPYVLEIEVVGSDYQRFIYLTPIEANLLELRMNNEVKLDAQGEEDEREWSYTLESIAQEDTLDDMINWAKSVVNDE